MTTINGKMWAGLVIHALVVWAISAGDYPNGLVAFMAIFLVMNVLGLLLVAMDNVRAGCVLFMIGSAVFVPIGVIGLIGARNVMDEMKRQSFSAQRS